MKSGHSFENALEAVTELRFGAAQVAFGDITNTTSRCDSLE